MKGLLSAILLSAVLSNLVVAYQVLISDQDSVRQVCSGMWGSGGVQEPFLEVIFSPSSRGQLALVIFEWDDAKYLGVDPTGDSPDDAWSDSRVYVCTLSALEANLCKEGDLGKFIITPPTSDAITTIFTASVHFDSGTLSSIPLPSSSDSSSSSASISKRQSSSHSGPYRYSVPKTGFYCVGTVPVLVAGGSKESDTSFSGVVDFENVFKGRLPAAERPKISFYRSLFFVYAIMGVCWSYLCYRNKGKLIAIQWYILGTIIFLVAEMMTMWRWYHYLNSTGHEGVSRGLLILVSVLNAGRNSLSFFMLLITSMGYGVVKPSLEPVMLKIRGLTLVHFVFGVLYSLGTTLIPLETAGFFIFLFVFPLAFSLTAFLMWIMWSLNATIADLDARKQSYKKAMFTRLYRILLTAVLSIGLFFILTSLTFSSRLNEDFIPTTWKYRWLLLDGLLAILYLLVFSAIAFLWRPTGNNKNLGLSDELPMFDGDDEDNDRNAMDEEDLDEAEEFEVEDTEGGKNVRMKKLGDDSVVFDVGDEDDEDEDDEESGVGMERRRLKSGKGSDGEDDDMGAPPSYRG